MIFTVGVITEKGSQDIKKFLNYKEAFEFSLLEEKANILPYIIEKQWSVKENKIVYEMYFTRFGCIYKSVNSLEPIYSNTLSFKCIEDYRNELINSIRNVNDIYEYYKLPTIYETEECYRLTLSEMEAFKNKITNDNIVLMYSTSLSEELKKLEKLIENSIFRIDSIMEYIKYQPIKDKLLFIQYFKRLIL